MKQIMEVIQYLEKKLENCSIYKQTDNDQEILHNQGFEEYIFHKVLNKKFRKYSVDDEGKNRIKEAIHINIKKNHPIQFTFPFGGYKLWRLETAPEVDWAEFFTIAYYSNYIAPILQIYKPGVEFIFSSDDLIIERMDNIAKTDTDAYFNSFQKLIDVFSKFYPKNFKMSIKRGTDFKTRIK